MPPFPVRGHETNPDARPGERQPWVTPEIEVLPRKKSFPSGSRSAGPGYL